MKIVSISENSLWFRLFILFVWFIVIFWLNYFLFAYFTWWWASIYLVILWIFSAILLWYLLRNVKYKYILENNYLIIKTPNKEYKVPFSDIKNVEDIDKIPFSNMFWMKYDISNKILYLCSFSKRWIMLDVWTHNIVIAPRKYEEFKKVLTNI